MGWFVLAHFLATLLRLLGIGRRSTADKDLEIMILMFWLPFSSAPFIRENTLQIATE